MDPSKRRNITVLLGIGLALLLVGRFFLLNADVPPWFAPWDLGLHLDDGYKTLSPRNLVEYGQTHWNPHDDYPGWFAASPLTQWPYYAAYSVGGVRLVSVRAVGVLFFVALIVAFLMTFRRVYPGWAVLTGMLLLTLEPMLYHFSRTALFEVPLALATCLGLFGVLLLRRRSIALQVVLLVVTAALATRLLKLSGLLYLTPAVGALLVLVLITRRHSRASRLAASVFAVVGIGWLLYWSQGLWTGAIYLENPAWFPQRLLNSGLQALSPLCMAAALWCLIHGLSTRPHAYLGDSYRLALISTFLGVPLILALFETPPPRYYPAMIASGPLLVIDHLARGPWSWRFDGRQPLWARLTVAALFVLLVWYLLRSLDYAVLRRLPLQIGDSPGIESITMYRSFAPLALFALVAGYFLPAWLARPRVFRPVLSGLVVGFALFGLADQVRALAFPTFDAHGVRVGLAEVTAPDSSIGGDWAPYLTLGTGRRALYVNDVYNRAERFDLLRPDYFLFAGSWQDELNLSLLSELEFVSTGPPIPLGAMLGNEITLYPLRYHESTAEEDSNSP